MTSDLAGSPGSAAIARLGPRPGPVEEGLRREPAGTLEHRAEPLPFRDRVLPGPDDLAGQGDRARRPELRAHRDLVERPERQVLLLVAGLLWWVQEGTRIGAMLRAGVDDEEIARALGINVSLLFTAVFALGAFLAALGGTMGGPIMGVYPGADFDVMLLGFVVIIIGGLGSLRGALVGGLIVGLLDNFGKVFFPEFALFTIFAPMALILAVRPLGLFGQE